MRALVLLAALCSCVAPPREPPDPPTLMDFLTPPKKPKNMLRYGAGIVMLGVGVALVTWNAMAFLKLRKQLGQ